MYQKFVQWILKEPFKALLLIFSLLILKELVYIATFTNKVSPIADGFSESNTIRGGTFFTEQGLAKYFGLPDLCYSEQFPTVGFKGYGECKTSVYTHYPPGPEYMAWLGLSVVGIGNYYALRMLPILLSIFAGIFFLKTVFDFIGGGKKGLILGLMLILPPMYSNYMHGLHHQQYAFLMLQVQIALVIRLFTNKISTWVAYVSFCILGFVQGWMSFDYAFLATLFVIPFYLLLRKEYFVSFLNFLLVGLASGLTFTLAHILHFYQVVGYLGSFDAAWTDLFGAAKFRANNTSSVGNPANPKFTDEIGPFTVAKDFLYRVAGRGKYLSINLINFIWIILGLKFVKRITLKKNRVLEFSITGEDLLALASSVLVSSMWSLIMKQHAHIHGFIARHYFFCYFFCCLILVRRTRQIDISNET